MIPLGQPILAGHHSEGRHRRDIGRIDSLMGKSIEADREAESMAHRADAAEANRSISSDDPEALTRLREKLTVIEAKRAEAVSINKAIRASKGDNDKAIAGLRALGLPAGLIVDYMAGDCFGYKGVAPFRLTNLASEARRIEKRIAALESTAARPSMAAEQIGNVTISETENRVQLIFPGKPTTAVIAQLKKNGFRWAPSAGAWQRMPSAWAWHMAREIAKGVV